MPPSEQPRVFISYARKDGAALAQRLQSDVTKEGFDTLLERVPSGKSSMEYTQSRSAPCYC